MGFFERLFGRKDEPPPPLPGDGEDQGASSGAPPPLALDGAAPAAKGAPVSNGKAKAAPQAQPAEDTNKAQAKPEAAAAKAPPADPKAAAAPTKAQEKPKQEPAKTPEKAAQPPQQQAKPADPKAKTESPKAPEKAREPAASAPAQAKTAAPAAAPAAKPAAPAAPAGAPQAQAKPQSAGPAQPQKPGAPSPAAPAQAAKPGAKPVAAPVAANAKPGAVPTPGQPAGAKVPGSKDLVEELISALDETFVESESSAHATAASPGTLEVDRAAVEKLFAEIAAQYARPVKEFIVELRRGTATREWIDVCRPALSSVSKAARSMNLEAAAKIMEDFDAALKGSAAAPGKDPKLSSTEQKGLLERYDRMVEVMPMAFSITEELRRRDGIIINALLKQIPDVGRVTLDKLFAAGLTSMDVLLLAKKDELAVASGVSTRIAEQICQKLREYQEQSSGTKRVDMKAYRKRLTELLAMLKNTHAAFVKADGDPSASDEKRRLRGARQNLVFQISIVLAELGEAEFVKECDKLTFERRILALEEFLARTAQRM